MNKIELNNIYTQQHYFVCVLIPSLPSEGCYIDKFNSTSQYNFAIVHCIAITHIRGTSLHVPDKMYILNN